MKKNYYWCFILFIIVAFIAIKYFSALSILGPWDKPNFSKMDWVEVKITYWIKIKIGEKYRRDKRIITIKDIAVINKLKSEFIIKEIKGLSLAMEDEFLITLKNGKKWQGRIVFEDTVAACNPISIILTL